MKPFISVLIPAYNEEALLPRAIEAIRTSFKPSAISYEIIVCDNNSSDATAQTAKQLGAHVVFEPHNQIARARNRAAQEARGEWLLFIDADSTLTPELAKETLEAMNSPRVCAGGAGIQFDGERKFLKTVPAHGWNFISARFKWMAGSYIFCRRSAWEETGGFDEKYYAAEEIIFSKKLKKWAKEHRSEIRILLREKILTSSRKFEMHSTAKLFWFFALASLPGAWRKKEFCELWYKR